MSLIGGPIQVRGPDDQWLVEILEGIEHEPVDRLTHGFHAYPARMHPALARRILERHAEPRQRVLDPFVGGGTVLVEAMARGCAAVGVDVNPVALRIARARTLRWSSRRIRAFVELARRIGEEAFQDARRRVSRPLSWAARRHRDRFDPHVLQELMGIQVRIRAIDRPGTRKLAELVLSSLLVKVSRQVSETVLVTRNKRVGRGTASQLFVKKAEELGARLAAFAEAVPSGTPDPDIRLADARNLPVQDHSVDLIITSPPYVGTYDYGRYQALRLDWLGESPAFMRDHEMGARHDVEGGKTWVQDEARVVFELARVLKPGGRAFLVAGDGVLNHQPYRVDTAIARAAREAGLRVEGIASQARPHVSRKVARIYRGAVRFEHLIALRKRELV